MSELETVRSLADLATELARIPDDTQLDWQTAALLINPRRPKSRKTMYRWRYTGEGPKFSKGTASKNAEVTYLAGDVRGWIKANRVESTIAARLRKVMRFETLQSIASNLPWVAHDKSIIGHVLTVSDSELRSAIDHMGGFHIEIASVDEALTEHRWSDAASRERFRVVFAQVLASRLRASETSASENAAGWLADQVSTPAVASCPKCGRPAHPGVTCRRL